MKEELRVIRQLSPNATSASMDALWNAFESVSKKKKGYKVSFAIFQSKSDPMILFDKWKPKDFSFRISPHEDFYEFKLYRVIKRVDIENGERDLEGEFGIYHLEDNLWLAFTSGDPDFFKTGLLRFIDSYRPDISRISLSSRDLGIILNEMEQKIEGDIFIKKAILYSHREEGEIKFRKPRNMSLDNLFAIAGSEDCIVDKLEYVVSSKTMGQLQSFITREGIAYYMGGTIRMFSHFFLKIYSEAANGRLKLLSERQSKTIASEMHPIDIIFDSDVFQSTEDNTLLASALSNIPRSGIAVLHKNPYFHAKILDFLDGSTFNVFVNDMRRITVVPGTRSSSSALMRLCEQVFRDFHEGRIESTPKSYMKM